MNSLSIRIVLTSVTFAPVLAGCSDVGRTPFEHMVITPSMATAPAVLPNVFRTQDRLVGGIPDTESGLIAFAGLPELPSNATACGGTEPFDLHEIQIVGLDRGVLNVLVKGDVHLHVYQLSSFVDFCTSTPFAAGTGRITLTDNDATVSGTRVNSFGASITGTVRLETGGTARLSAHSRIQIDQDGSFRIVSRKATLSGS